LFAALVATSAFAQVTNWPAFQFGNDRLGFNPYETVLRPSTVSHLGQLWQAHPVSDVIYASPVLANGLLYGISFDSGEVFAVDAHTGAIVWRHNVPGQFFLSSPTVVGDVLYVGSGFFLPYYTGAVYALNAHTGEELWRNANVNAIQTAPTVGGGLVYVGSDFGVIYALDGSTGQVRWSYDTTIGAGTGSAGALVNGVLYLGLGQFLFAMNAADGRLLWRKQLSYDIASSPAVQNGVVYINSYDGGVYALDAGTGAVIWHRVLRTLYFTSLSVAYGKLYLCGFDGAPGLAALDQQTGNTLWTRAAVQCNYASPVVANGVLYVGWEALGGAGSYIMAFDAGTGGHLWEQHVDTAIYGEPIVANGQLYVTTYGGEVMAFGLNHN
jgi:eukaryotic-like serine/threonine-protein kinase